MLLALQSDIIYGPVQSRRLGRSLGVNVLPPRQKIYSSDCLYCQYGRLAPVNAAEATLHPCFRESVEGVREIKGRLSPWKRKNSRRS